MSMRCTHPPAGLPAERAEALRAQLPVIETERLSLRAATLADFPAWARLLVPDDEGFMGGPHTEEEAWEAFCVYVAGWLLHGHGLWTVTRKSDASALGFVLAGLEWGDAEPELGWMLLPEARGQGLATEAARAARDWALGAGGLDSLVSYVHPGNAASIALAQRLGASRNARNPHPAEGALAFRHEAAA
jgi:RimJ/RimL family protein N-acetyltransferase